VQYIVSYLVKMKHAAIRIHTEEPNFSALPGQQFDWAYTVYGHLGEILTHDMSTPLGRFVTLMHYVDANLYHDLITGRSLHLANKAPIDWYSVETATYGSEFIAARICVDQSIDLKNTLHYLGVPIHKKAYMFGDNKSPVNSSMSHMLSSTSNTIHCLSTKLGKPLLLPSLDFITLKAKRILLTSSASIGDTSRSGSYSNLCSSEGETPRTSMCSISTKHRKIYVRISNKRGVTRITQELTITV